MFVRKNKKTLLQKGLDFIYPSIGFKRAIKYIAHRLGRLPATPYQIACGFACGAGISFTPFLGLHFALSALIAFILRGSIIASAFGTVVGNPITFPFIWALVYPTGELLLGIHSDINITELFRYTLNEFGKINQWHFTLINDYSNTISTSNRYFSMWSNIWNKIYPLIIGSLVWFVIVWLLFFSILYPLINYYKKIQHNRRTKHKNTKNLKRKD